MALAINKSAKILVGSFFDTYFKAENKEEAKEKAFEIVDLFLDENKENLNNFATKGDLLEVKNELKKDIMDLKTELTNSKYDLLKWIFTAQIAVTSLAVAVIKLF